MAATQIRVVRDVEIGGEEFRLLVETRHAGGVVAWTAVHRQDMPRRIGGARFVEKGDLREVGHLSSTMTSKCLASRLPADGQKSLIVCPEGIPQTMAARAKILTEHIRAVIAEDPGVIFGPDMNNPEAVMDLVAEDDELLDYVTGLSDAKGGIAIDKNGFTAYGVMHAIEAAKNRAARPLKSATIQGWGAVGAHLGRMLPDHGIQVIAVSTYLGAITASNGAGLDVEALFEDWLRLGDEAVRAPELASGGYQFSVDRDVLLTVPSDLWVPAARPSVFAMPDELAEVRAENPDVKDVETFFAKTRPAMVAEGANHPLSMRAEAWLEDHGVVVLPDFVANCGGLIGCFFEWAYRRELLEKPTLRSAIDSQARRYIRDVVRHNVDLLGRSDGYARAAADRIVASNRAALDAAMASNRALDVHAMAGMLLASGTQQSPCEQLHAPASIF